MAEETSNKEQQTESNKETTDAWAKVGKQFQILGDTIVSAVSASLENEETRQQLDKMRTEFETAARQMNQAVKDTVESEQGQQVRAETEKFARAAQKSGKETIEEIKPHLLAAFRTMQAGLEQIIKNIESQPAKSAAESKPDESGSDGETTEAG